MNYPVWYLSAVGGGTLIALIAVVHVFISHFAVGGGLYLVCAERKALRENNGAILDFTKKHAKFFMLMTLVMGGITGVGIWFIIALVNPAATSILIHVFVFGWATEWVFFVVEIVAIMVYYYCFAKMDARTHQVVGWIYFIAAWLSLFLINGIIGYMLTPGNWPVDRDFWSGFFNPSFWPSLFFRTFVSLMLAGVYAFITTSFLKDRELKVTMTRYSGKWVLASFAAAVPSGFWYLSVLPNEARALVHGASPTIQKAMQFGLYAAIAVVAGTLLLVILRPAFHTRLVSFVVLAGAFLLMGAFEWTREASRRPFVINEFMYSNSILKGELETINSNGFLTSARWVSVRDADGDNLLQAGEEIFKNQCYSCHSIGGINNDIAVRTRFMDYEPLVNYIGKIHQIRYLMPPFAGTDAERKALAYYIVKGIHGKDVDFTAEKSKVIAERGEELFEENCAMCHPAELVKAKTAGWDRARIRGSLDNLNSLNSAMPDYEGTPAEKEEMTDYIHSLQKAPRGEIHDEGEEIFEKNCGICHTLRDGTNPLLPKITGWDRNRIRNSLDMLDRLRGGMPPLEEPPARKDDLAEFLYKSLQGGSR